VAKPKFALELKAGVGAASFMADGKAVDLTDENPVYETDDESTYRALRELDFLKDAGKAKNGGGD
jgi:hypothetical protein